MFDGVAFGKEMVGIVKGHVARALAPLMARIDALEQRAPRKGLDGKDGRNGEDGKDADLTVIAQIVSDEVAKAVEALPPPQDGKSVTAEDVRPLIAELVSTALADAVKALPVPQDGRDGRNGLDAVTPLLKDGVLLFTMSDGTVKEIGRVSGNDGKDGDAGADGVDGLGFDDFAVEYDGERGITLRFTRDGLVKEFEFTMPVIIDRGVWVEGKGYAPGDAVTWAGSVWIAQKDTSDKPDGGTGWRLAVKRGRDGKDGVVRDMSPRPVRVG